VLRFVHDRVTPVAEWIRWTGGDPELVILVVAETLRSIADSLEGEPVSESTQRRAAMRVSGSSIPCRLARSLQRATDGPRRGAVYCA
jgi:hypothetical protein